MNDITSRKSGWAVTSSLRRLSGSLRRESYNRALLAAAQEIVPAEAELKVFDLEGLPLFNQDLENEPCERVQQFKATIRAADALLIVGSNPRKEAAILNARIRQRWRGGKFSIGVIGPKADLTYTYDYVGAGPETSEIECNAPNESPPIGFRVGSQFHLREMSRNERIDWVCCPALIRHDRNCGPVDGSQRPPVTA